MSETKRALNCIVCPMSCSGTVTMEDGKITNLEGFTCPRGKAYAQEELTAPKRMLTTTVRVEGGALALLPVMSIAPLQSERIIDVTQRSSLTQLPCGVLAQFLVCSRASIPDCAPADSARAIVGVSIR